MNRVVHIILGAYYLFDEDRIVYGGVQSYFTNLMPLFHCKGFQCKVYQPDKVNGTVTLPYCELKAYDVSRIRGPEKQSEFILRDIMKTYDDSKDVLLFSTDALNCKNNVSRSLSVQHGIYWDIPQHTDYSPHKNALFSFRKAFNAYEIIERNNYVKRIVCVDYNFMNWYKAVSAYTAIPMTVIPNFTKIAPICRKPKEKVSIMFARRLRRYRGANLFAESIAPVLNRHPEVELTVAGIGPEEGYMRKVLEPYKDRVVFTQYKAEDSLAIHSDKHIAVVPTIGSEGTSLSLLEAMSAQCAVICTSTGGLSNIVIDEYNGLVVSPTPKSLEDALERLVTSPNYREELARRGFETVKYGFSYEKWKEKWLGVIEEILSE
ncbi:MAG: glycosyltransferase family 4 protein [Prevotella sp.]|nr:glycosyltransferase family 4 protein [Prevotella sp.]